MNRDEIDALWQQAMHDAIAEGEQMTRYHFADLVAAAEREALRAELREATEAVDDPAVNNLRTLPEAIRMLRAQRDELLRTLMAVDTAPSLPGPVRLAIRFAIAKATGETP